MTGMVAISRVLFKNDVWSTSSGPHGKYKLEVNTKDPYDIEGKIFHEGKKYKVDSKIIKWKGIENLSKENLLELVLKSKEKFKIKITPTNSTNTEYCVKIILKNSLKSKLSSQTQPPIEEEISLREKKTKEPSFLTCTDAHDFVKISHEPNIIYTNTFSKMVDDFCHTSGGLSNAAIDDITAIIAHLSSEEIIRVIDKLTSDISINPVNKEPSLRGLTIILSFIYRATIQKAFEIAKSNQSKDSEDYPTLLKNSLHCSLNANQLVRLLDAITINLRNEHTAPDSLIIFLRTSIAIIEIMLVLEVSGLDREKHHEKFVGIFSDFKSHKDCRVAFLAEYGKQCFKIIKNNESTPHAILRRSFYILKGISTIVSSISLTEPWLIFAAVNSIEDFKKAFSNLHIKYEWFKKLRILQEFFLHEKHAIIVPAFEKFVQLQPDKAKLFLPDQKSKRFHFFVQGLITLLQQVIDTFGSGEKKTAHSALSLLEKIRNDNSRILSIADPMFKVEEEYADTIKREVDQLLLHYQKYPKASISKKTKSILKQIQQNESKNLSAALQPQKDLTNKSELPNSEKKGLFIDSLKAVVPWISGVNNMQDRMERDPQVIDEWEFAIALKGKDRDLVGEIGEPLEGKLEAYLNDSKNKVIAIFGNSGSGKSLFSKLHVLEQLDTYNPNKPLSLYISMTTIRQPNGSLMDEILKQLNLTTKEEIEFLKNNKVRLFIDSYDEWFIKGRMPNDGLINLYDENHLDKLWPKLQLIIMCRNDSFLQKGDSIFFTPRIGQLQIIFAAPFERDDIKTIYLPKYIQVRQKRDKKKKNPLPLWKDVSRYTENIEKLNLWDVISNPFNLKVMADTLPSIVQRHAQSLDNNSKRLEVTKENLFDEFICQRFQEEFIRQREFGSPIKGMREYLDFACELSRNLQYCNIRSVSKNDKEQLENNVNAFIKAQENKMRLTEASEKELEQEFTRKMEKAKETEKEALKKQKEDKILSIRLDKESIRKNINEAKVAPDKLWHQLFDTDGRTMSLRRACFLVKRDHHIEFLHSSIYEHLRGIDGIPQDKKRINKRINELEKIILRKDSLF